MNRDALQLELRQVFRDELEDQLVAIERQTAVLGQGDDSQAGARKAAVSELYRAVHSLKGASRAAGYLELETACHAFEDELAVLRKSEVIPFDIGVSLGSRIHETLSSWLAKVTRDVEGSEEAAPASPAPGSEAPSEHPARTGSGAPSAAQQGASSTVRVAVKRLDALITAVEELIVRAHRPERHSDAAIADTLSTLEHVLEAANAGLVTQSRVELEPLLLRALGSVKTLGILIGESESALDSHARSLSASSNDVLARARSLRLVELGSLAPAVERACRESAKAVSKTVELELDFSNVELDRRIADALREPLLHLVRNAVDHGAETEAERRALGKPPNATVRVSAKASGREVQVTIEDDGRGIDQNEVEDAAKTVGVEHGGPAAELVFEAGVSTRGAAGPLSGRGMGLNIVRERVSSLHGRISVDSRTGTGTRLTLFVPYDLGMLRALFVDVSGELCAIVTTSIERLVAPTADAIRVSEGKTYLLSEDRLIPLLALGDLLGFGSPGEDIRTCVIIAAGERRAAFSVDAVLDERDILVKGFGRRIRRVPYCTGVTTVDGDRLALVLDAGELLREARPGTRPVGSAPPPARHILLVDDSVTTRQLLKTVLTAAGYQVSVAQDGSVAWRMLQTADYDLIVSDIEMPHVDGFELLSRVRATHRTARLPVIMVTALSSDADRQRAMDLSANAYVVKRDFDQTTLLETIEELL